MRGRVSRRDPRSGTEVHLNFFTGSDFHASHDSISLSPQVPVSPVFVPLIADSTCSPIASDKHQPARPVRGVDRICSLDFQHPGMAEHLPLPVSHRTIGTASLTSPARSPL